MSFFRRPASGLILVVLIFVALGFAYSVTAPYATGPDEVAHFQFIRFVAQHHRLPLNETERTEASYKSDLPPLFHLLVGLAGAGIDLTSPPFIKVTHDTPRLQLVVGVENVLAWRAINTEDPYQSEVLLWYLARWGALLCGAITLGITYLLLRSFWPHLPWVALGGTAVLAFIPTYLQVSSVISYEPLAGALMAGYFLLLFRAFPIGQAANLSYEASKKTRQLWTYLALGLLLGLACLTRQTVWPLLLILPLSLAWLAHRQDGVWSKLVLAGLGLSLTFGLWLLYMALYFNQIDRLGWSAGLLQPFLVGDGSGKTSLQIAGLISGGQVGLTQSGAANDSLLQWIWAFFNRVWGGGWMAWVLLGLWLLALAGLGYGRRRVGRAKQTWLILLGCHLLALISLPLVRFWFSGQASTAFGQHLLFPAGAILILLLVWGLSAWLKPAQLAAVLFLVAGGYLIQIATLLAGEYQPPWPVQTVPLAAGEQALAIFEMVTLLHYTSQADDQTLTVTLQWRTESQAAEDYRLELTLADGGGQAVSRWIGQPLNGRYPTRAWLPGDRVRTSASLPIAGLPAGEYRLHLRWLGQAGAALPQLAGHLSQQVTIHNDRLDLGAVTLTPAPSSTEQMVLLNGQPLHYSLWPQPGPQIYQENSTVTISTAELLGHTVQVSLVGPDGVAYPAGDQTGRVYNFTVESHFASGDYHLRFEQRDGDQVVAQTETPPLLNVKTQERQFQTGSISHPVGANFAGYVTLLGYDLPQRHVQSGDAIPVTLYWQALKPIGADLIMFNHLIDSDQKVWGGRDRRAREVYSTLLWAPGEVVADSFQVQVQAAAPAGIYQVLVGLYLPVGEASVSLPLLQNGYLSDATNVSLGAIKVGSTPAGFTVQTAQPQILFQQTFGDPPSLTLLGYDLDNCQLTIDNCQLSITLYWRSESPLPLDYTIFVHLRNGAGETVAQKDQPPLNGVYPTGLWSPGEIIADTIEIPWPGKLPAGKYELMAGWYDPSTGQRLTVPNHPANEVRLTDVELP